MVSLKMFRTFLKGHKIYRVQVCFLAVNFDGEVVVLSKIDITAIWATQSILLKVKCNPNKFERRGTSVKIHCFLFLRQERFHVNIFCTLKFVYTDVTVKYLFKLLKPVYSYACILASFY